MGGFVIGIDVGGTNIKLGLVAVSGRIMFRTALPTKTFIRSSEDLISLILEGCETIIRKSNLKKGNFKRVVLGEKMGTLVN